MIYLLYDIENSFDIDTEKENKSKAHKKTIRLRNIHTKKILKFDSRESCAKFFNTSVRSLNNFINGDVQSKIFADYRYIKR